MTPSRPLSKSLDALSLHSGQKAPSPGMATTLHRVSAPAVDAVNTNGAGDMFAGAFLYALSRGENDQRATEFATLAASEVVKSFGPRLDRAACLALRHQFFGD